MSKNNGGLGKFLAFAAIAGAVAAGISYLTKYKSFHKELEKDFCDFEDNDTGEIKPPADSTMDRSYVALNADKNEIKVAARDMADAARDMAGAARETMKDAVSIVSETATDAKSLVSDTAKLVSDKAKDKVQDLSNHLRSTTITEDDTDYFD